MPSKHITVLIADDDPLSCEAIRLSLVPAGDLEVIGIAYDGDQAVSMAADLKPDIIILDISMPGIDGLDALAVLRKTQPEATIVVITAHSRPNFVVTAIARGASAYVTKSTMRPGRLINIIHRTLRSPVAVLEGVDLRAAMGDVQETVKRGLDAEDLPRGSLIGLSNLEYGVLKFLVRDYDEVQIARELVISDELVRTHIESVQRKLGLSNRAELSQLITRLRSS